MKIYRHHFLGILYVAFFCLLSLGQLQRIEWGSLPAFYLHDLCLVGCVMWHMFDKNFRRNFWEYVRKSSTVEKVGLIWVGAGLLIAALSGVSLLQSTLYLGRLFIYFLGLCCLSFDLKSKRISPKVLWLSLFTFIILHIYFGLLQYIFIPDTRILFFLGWDDHYYRLISTMFDPGFAGILYVLSFLIAASWLLKNSHDTRASKPLLFLGAQTIQTIALLSMLCTLLTYSRASYLAFLASCGLLLIVTIKKNPVIFRLTALSLASFLILIPLLPRPGGEGVRLERTSTIIARTTSAQASLKTFTQPYQFLIGQGLFVQPPTEVFLYSGKPIHAKVPDSWLILFFTGTGVIGTILLTLILFQKGKALFKQSSFAWIGLVAILIHGMFNASLIYPFVILLFGTWVILSTPESSP